MGSFGDDQKVLGQNLPCFMMEPINCPNSEPLGYYDDSSTSEYWAYASSIDLSSGPFNSDVIIPSGFDQPCAGAPWLAPDYQHGSPLSSDQDSMGRAPSTNTSYNEIDHADPVSTEFANRETLFCQGPEPSSPRSPRFEITHSPIPAFPAIAPRLDADMLFDLSGPAPIAMSRIPTTAEPFKCQEGCSGKTFGRQYELDRHIREQHRCPHEDCTGVRFSSSKEKKDHDRHHCETGLGYRCGTCVLHGITAKTLSRGEKLKKHFKDAHEVEDNFDFRDFQCLEELCYVSKAFGGIFFASQRELEEHRTQVHSNISAGAEMSQCGANACSNPPYERLSAVSGEKRPLNSASGSDAKRGKTKQVSSAMAIPSPHAYSTCYSEDDLLMPSAVSPPIPHTIKPRVDGPGTSSSSHPKSLPVDQSEKAFPLSMVELHALTKHQNWNSLIEKLQALSISPIFDSKASAIKLRGSFSFQLDEGKCLVEVLIGDIRAKTPTNDYPDVTVCESRKPAYHQQVSVHPQPEIFALDPKDNADVLTLWNKRLLPSFPVIVQEASIKGSYSVSLICQKFADGVHPVIRFRSSHNQSTISRQVMRESVKNICVESGSPELRIQFTEGTLVRLVGRSLEGSIPDDPPYDQRFPHERRPWDTPGLSASIGLGDCPHVSATLGGYISVDNRRYILTVDHFISECPCSRSIQVRSPSISDIQYVKDQLEKKIEELSLRIRQNAPNEIPLSQVDEVLFAGDIDEELQQYKRFERELDGPASQFALAMVRERCGGSQPRLRPSMNPLLQGACHRMDWSLSEVNVRHRMGKNLHRYGRVHEPTLGHLQAEMNRPEGIGPPCTATIDVVPGEPAYYVGTTSGLREGCVNPALVQYGDEHGVTHEWAMVVPDCERLGVRDFQGDSGAWIMSNDNRLMGLLWGWDNGNLLFTPIQDVFADIAQKMKVNTHLIKLPEDTGPRSRQGSLLSRRSNGTLREVYPQELDQPVGLPVTARDLLSPVSSHERSHRRGSSGTDSACSISSTPSLLSSASSFVEDIATRVHTPQSPIPPPLSTVDGTDVKVLPIRTKARVAPGIEAIEEWVCIQYDDNAIDEKFSALQLATNMPNTALPYTRM